MKTIQIKKSNHVLEAPIEALHEQSVEWLEEIEFWKDEVAFFYKLLMHATKDHPSLMKTPEAKKVEKHLIEISVNMLDELRMEVEGHEKFLSRIMDDTKMDDHLYRSRHAVMTIKFTGFAKEFRQMKKVIFDIVKKTMTPAKK